MSITTWSSLWMTSPSYLSSWSTSHVTDVNMFFLSSWRTSRGTVLPRNKGLHAISSTSCSWEERTVKASGPSDIVQTKGKAFNLKHSSLTDKVCDSIKLFAEQIAKGNNLIREDDLPAHWAHKRVESVVFASRGDPMMELSLFLPGHCQYAQNHAKTIWLVLAACS